MTGIISMRVFIAFITFVLFSFINTPLYSKCPEVLKNISLTDMNGQPAKLRCTSHRVLVVNLWATWCSPCRVEIPHLVELYRELKSQGIEIIGISLDSVNSPSVLNFVKSQKIKYPVYIGNADDIFNKMSVNAVPATFIIDSKGRINNKLVGLYTKDELKGFIIKALKATEKPLPAK
jgi:thiol-disulfide isomerase/thioredoxin